MNDRLAAFVPCLFVLALAAPQRMLHRSGDQDHNAPPDGVETLERKLAAVYQFYDRPEHFRSVLYLNTGHEYLPEMRREMVAWFERHLSEMP